MHILLSRRPSFLVVAVLAAAALLLPLARAGAQSFTFALNKGDAAVLKFTGAGFNLSDESYDRHTDKSRTLWKVTGFKRKEQGTTTHFVLLKQGGGSEVQLEMTHLPAVYQPAQGNGVSNVGDWVMTLSGHGPAFDKLRHDLLTGRGGGWDNDDLIFHGSGPAH